MRSVITSILLAITIPVGEIHTFFLKDSCVQNWIITKYVPMPMAWNVKFVENQLIVMMYFAAWILWRPLHINRATVVAFFLFSLIDTVLYFYNYKQYGYGSVYFLFIGLWLLFYYCKNITDWIWERLL